MATLEEQVMAQMKDAMKSKDEALLRGLRAIKAEIIKAKTDPGAGGAISAEVELKLLQKLVKSRKDSLTIYQEQNRARLSAKRNRGNHGHRKVFAYTIRGRSAQRNCGANHCNRWCERATGFGKSDGRGIKATSWSSRR